MSSKQLVCTEMSLICEHVIDELLKNHRLLWILTRNNNGTSNNLIENLQKHS